MRICQLSESSSIKTSATIPLGLPALVPAPDAAPQDLGLDGGAGQLWAILKLEGLSKYEKTEP